MRPECDENAGFSLIELIMVIAVLSVLTGFFFIGPQAVRSKETGRYAKELCSRIRLMRSQSMAKPGQWRLAMYEQDGVYFCVQEKKLTDESGKPVWTAWSEETKLGQMDVISYEYDGGFGGAEVLGGKNAADNGRRTVSGDTPLFAWSFNRDTGACLEGAGIYKVSGAGVVRQIKVYARSGRCEEGRNEDEEMEQ